MSTFTEKFKAAAAGAHKMASNWVMAGASGSAAVYLSLDPGDRLSLVQGVNQHLHMPAYVLPIIVGVAGIGARLWPQKSITPAEAAAKSEDAPQPKA